MLNIIYSVFERLFVQKSSNILFSFTNSYKMLLINIKILLYSLNLKWWSMKLIDSLLYSFDKNWDFINS